jgi:hypothetical protein
LLRAGAEAGGQRCLGVQLALGVGGARRRAGAITFTVAGSNVAEWQPRQGVGLTGNSSSCSASTSRGWWGLVVLDRDAAVGERGSFWTCGEDVEVVWFGWRLSMTDLTGPLGRADRAIP